MKYEYFEIYYRNAYKTCEYAWLSGLHEITFIFDGIFFVILLVASNCKMSNTGIIELDDAASNNLMMESTSFCHVNMATEA